MLSISRNISKQLFTQLRKNVTQNIQIHKRSLFSNETSNFISSSLKIDPSLRSRIISTAKSSLAEYNKQTEKTKANLLSSKENGVDVKSIRTYNSLHANIPQGSIVWHINLGNTPILYFGKNNTCDLDTIIAFLNKYPQDTSLMTKPPLIIEDRGTSNGQNLFSMILSQQNRHLVGVGADINVPNIRAGRAMCRHLGLEDVVHIGYGSAHEISAPVSGINKVITLINLLSVMSLEDTDKVIASVSKSLSIGDCVLIQNMSKNSNNINSTLNKSGEENAWKELPNMGDMRSFHLDYGYSIKDVEKQLSEKKLGVYSEELDEGVTKGSNFIQYLTFHSIDSLEKILHKYGLKRKDVALSTCEDGRERITMFAIRE